MFNQTAAHQEAASHSRHAGGGHALPQASSRCNATPTSLLHTVKPTPAVASCLTLCLSLYSSAMLVLQSGQAGLGLPQAPTQGCCLITGCTCFLLGCHHLFLQSSDFGSMGACQLLK